jgi:hypothetical protein
MNKKINFLLIGMFGIFLNIQGQETNSNNPNYIKYPGDSIWRKSKSVGIQLGYCSFKTRQFDCGINYYWSKFRNQGGRDDCYYRQGDYFPNRRCFKYHTFGPSLGGVLNLTDVKPAYGLQFGFNYHYGFIGFPRIFLGYEYYVNGSKLFGLDVGVSYFGLYLYGGYHIPIKINGGEDFSRLRLGLRYIFNPHDI